MRKIAIAIALLLLASSSFAATHQELFASGKQAFLAGDTDKAAELFEQAVKLQPNSADYLYWLGNAYGRQAQKANVFKMASLAGKTRDAFEKASKLDPNNLDVRSALINYYMMAPGTVGGSEQKALEQASEIRKRDPLLGHRAFASVYTFQKKPELARQEYLAGIREQPQAPKAHHYYGMFLAGEKDYKGALQEFETAAAFDPPFMPAYFRIGVVSVLSGSNYARGEEALKKYLTHKPLDEEPAIARAHYWLGQIYEKQGRKADAKQSYATSLKLAPGTKDVTEALKRVS
jgi:Tfp pilus assembly protein PilF